MLTVAADLSQIPGGTEVVTRPIAPPLYLTGSIISRANPPLGPAGRAVWESLAAFILEVMPGGVRVIASLGGGREPMVWSVPRVPRQ